MSTSALFSYGNNLYVPNTLGIFNADGSAGFTFTSTGVTVTGTSDFGTAGIKADVIQGSTGTTGNFAVKLVDNLADALTIKEGTNAYLRFVTTDGAEVVNVYKTLQVDAHAGLTATTGTFKTVLADNQADAYSVQEGSNKYLTFQTTDSAESVNVIKLLALSAGVNLSVSGSSTAAAGTTNADAAALPAGGAGVYPTTGADGVKGVIVSTSDKVTGRVVFIGNGVSNQILKVYPPSGGTINGAAANAAFSSASGKGVILICLSGGSNTWFGF